MSRPGSAALPIAGRVVAITGGSRGIGLAIAEALVARGARVALGDLDGERAGLEAQALGPGAIGLALDVSDASSFAAFLAAVERRLGPLDVLVNNAGVMWVGPFADEPEQAARRQLDVNFHGAANGLRLASVGMRVRGRGHVVTVASAASRLAPAGEATYAASKHAILGYATAVRAELRGSGVELSVVMPIVVETELAAGTTHGRGRRLVPADVAAAVVSTLERPRFEVFVPGAVGLLPRLLALLPERARERVLRLTMPDQLADADPAARRAYQQRQGLAEAGEPR